MIPINHGMIGSDSIPIISGKCETSGSNWRRLSISFSQEIIWFEVGMLWDASNQVVPSGVICFILLPRLLVPVNDVEFITRCIKAQAPEQQTSGYLLQTQEYENLTSTARQRL